MAEDTVMTPLARHVLGSMFGWSMVVTFHNVENTPSPEMRKALDELVSVGALVLEKGMPDMPAHGLAERYRVAKGFDVEPFRKEAAAQVFSGDAPSVRLFVKKS